MPETFRDRTLWDRAAEARLIEQGRRLKRQHLFDEIWAMHQAGEDDRLRATLRQLLRLDDHA